MNHHQGLRPGAVTPGHKEPRTRERSGAMPTNNITETIAELQRAALQVAAGFERAQKLGRLEQAEAMREAACALIEMRRTTDYLAQRLR